MEDKKFNCKVESLPVMGSFLLLSFSNDKQQFIAYSPVFDDPFEAGFKAKVQLCSEMISTENVVKLQKSITVQLSDRLGDLRPLLNPIEGYIKLAGKRIDILPSDFGLKQARDGISNKSPEVTLTALKSIVANLTRNKAVLETVGYKEETVTLLNAIAADVTQLNEQQNVLKNKRSRDQVDVIKEHNALWDIMNKIFSAGRAIYRGVDDVKLREYTFSHVKKRVEGTTPTSEEKPEEKEEKKEE